MYLINLLITFLWYIMFCLVSVIFTADFELLNIYLMENLLSPLLAPSKVPDSIIILIEVNGSNSSLGLQVTWIGTLFAFGREIHSVMMFLQVNLDSFWRAASQFRFWFVTVTAAHTLYSFAYSSELNCTECLVSSILCLTIFSLSLDPLLSNKQSFHW